MNLTRSNYFVNFMAFVILVDAFCTCWDIDSRAAGIESGAIIDGVSDMCLSLYTLEVFILFVIKGKGLFKDWVVFVDVAVIACGYLEMILEAFGLGTVVASIGISRALRLMRIFRLTRLLRKTRTFRELQKLVRMAATCLRALLWSFVFCFMVMTIWAMLMVEWIYPLVLHLNQQQGLFADCEWCLEATSSVMQANLLLFKTVIAGDSWGLVAVPVIQQYPATAIIFMGSLLTLVFGVLNLIVAVVVDNFAESRQRDVLNLAEEMEDNLASDTKYLEEMFRRIDEDESGLVTFEELLEGARKDKEFQSRLRVMDIDESDLQQLFEMIDVKGEGSIHPQEFIKPLSRWVHDSKTAPRFIKYNMLRCMEQQEELYQISMENFEFLSSRMDNIALILERLPFDGVSLADLDASPSMPVGRDVASPTPSFHLGDPTSSIPLQVRQPRSSPASPEMSMTLSANDPMSLSARTEALDVVNEVVDEVVVQQASVQDEESLVEQPHASKIMGTMAIRKNVEETETPAEQQDKALVKAAMQNLEATVVTATQAALKRSMVAVERALQERWSDGREDAVSRRQQEAKALLKLFEQKRRVSVNGRTKSPSKEGETSPVRSRRASFGRLSPSLNDPTLLFPRRGFSRDSGDLTVSNLRPRATRASERRGTGGSSSNFLSFQGRQRRGKGSKELAVARDPPPIGLCEPRAAEGQLT